VSYITKAVAPVGHYLRPKEHLTLYFVEVGLWQSGDWTEATLPVCEIFVQKFSRENAAKKLLIISVLRNH
jgi:hypothetical protein